MNKQTETDLTIARNSAAKRIKDIQIILRDFGIYLEHKDRAAVDILIADLREDATHLGQIADELARIAKDELDA